MPPPKRRHYVNERLIVKNKVTYFTIIRRTTRVLLPEKMTL